MKSIKLIGLALLLALNYVHAQRTCGTEQHLLELAEEDPSIIQKVNEAKTQARQYVRHLKSQRNQRRAVITIPVVVHVMHNGQAIGAGANISDAQVTSQFEVLNEDYRALNTDISDVPAHFSSVVADVEVEFCLASFDPEGNPTNGIDRVDMGSSSFGNSMQASTIWNRNEYLNIWTVTLNNGTLGYATPPGTSVNGDGVVVDYKYFGKAPDNPFNSDFDLGRTATHEIGHWLGLDHTFSGGCSGTSSSNCQSSGDGICDTPPTSSSNYGCSLPTNRNTCTETPNDLPDMWMNYMDYMDDACLFMFTRDQADVMLSVLNTSRSGIKNSIVCDAQNLFSVTGQVVDAQSGLPIPEASVFFNSNTYQFDVTTDANGIFTYPYFREGDYAIYAGKWGYMTSLFTASRYISDTTTSIQIPIEPNHYYDDFILNFGWAVSGNAETGRWERDKPLGTFYNNDESNPGDDVAGDFGEKCYMTGNGGGSAGNDDVDNGNTVLTSPMFDLTTYGDPYISFYRWFYNDGGQGTAPNDELVITLSNGIRDTVIDQVELTDNEWQFINIRVIDYITPTADMMVTLETSDLVGTGHLVEAAIDRFEVVDSMPINVGIFEATAHFSSHIYPNPTQGRVHIEITTEVPLDVTLKVTSVSGQLIDKIPFSQTQAISFQYDFGDVPQGIYFVTLESVQYTQTKRIAVY